MARQLPKNPSLSSLKYQAKQILKSHRSKGRESCEVLRFHTRFKGLTDGDILGSEVSLMEIQHALALSYGLADWKALLEEVSQQSSVREQVRVLLERMFRGGPLRALPKRRRDRKLFLALAASSLSDRASTEEEINDQLRTWLAPIAVPHALDHVQVRRALIDYGFLHRTVGGASYWLEHTAITEILGDTRLTEEPSRILDALEIERAARKRAWCG